METMCDNFYYLEANKALMQYCSYYIFNSSELKGLQFSVVCMKKVFRYFVAIKSPVWFLVM